MRLGLTLLLITVLVLGVAGCSRDTKSSHLVEPDASAAATMSTEITGSAVATATGDDPDAGDAEGTDPDAASTNLGSQELDAIEAELEAIENELSSMALPEDADFDEIESALY